MGEFTATIANRLAQAYQELREATSNGDEFLAETLTGEIEDLRRIAEEHGIDVDSLAGEPVDR
ncbi:MAG: hypothetical protein IRY84_13565 [Thermobispora bispora]|nr:hypothetical protein [Actinomycetales bacterium]MBX6168650.1 hypothetical protein [Thermobispora bispora]MDI9581873.1 hypothetical protein [Thermobispora sp.]